MPEFFRLDEFAILADGAIADARDRGRFTGVGFDLASSALVPLLPADNPITGRSIDVIVGRAIDVIPGLAIPPIPGRDG